MNKKELIEAVAEQADLPKSKAEMAINAFLHSTQEALVRGESVQLIGFGTFGVGTRSARKGRNPQTGAEIDIPAAKIPQFKAGSKLKDAVNN
ncbi:MULTISPECIES: HU family DNA-binding protein [Kistimonas]|uniref:DNA-binding protein HU n=2 Tax=cellular organisms TaxID=131567 RepID=A0AAV4H015_9GAST|nr:HU family DNA-binding protein [Kistimonas asteriae]OQX36122.1 MAG: integration host factor subunit alpha [Oceanospirillales bacterium LUC14_002_19_P2]GFR90864.1 DNA-binding protein HU [Elysia marginata]